MSQAGYSGTPLAKKLGLKDGQSVAIVNLPASLDWLLSERALASLESAASHADLAGADFDYIHLFTDSATTLSDALPKLRARIRQNGMIWVSWPKKASKVPTDITEDTIRTHALADSLVDVKVCAVDDIWSGLKLVIRKELRT